MDTAEDTAEKTREHLAFLHERVYETRTKYPHFDLMLRNVAEMAESLPPKTRVISFERTLLYGGFSLVAPLFHQQDFVSIDCSPRSADNRGAYCKHLIDEDDRFIKIPFNIRASLLNSQQGDDSADIVMIPNLVHHVDDQAGLWQEAFRIIRPGGKLYVFEPIIRELHQMPDDYVRYTPFGLKNTLEKAGFTTDDFETEGGPFSAIAYCWLQAIQYFPEDLREEKRAWLMNEHFPALFEWDKTYPENLFRQHTQFPMSFSLFAEKPNVS